MRDVLDAVRAPQKVRVVGLAVHRVQGPLEPVALLRFHARGVLVTEAVLVQGRRALVAEPERVVVPAQLVDLRVQVPAVRLLREVRPLVVVPVVLRAHPLRFAGRLDRLHRLLQLVRGVEGPELPGPVLVQGPAVALQALVRVLPKLVVVVDTGPRRVRERAVPVVVARLVPRHGVPVLLVETHAAAGLPLGLVQDVALLVVHVRQVPHLRAVLEVGLAGLLQLRRRDPFQAPAQVLVLVARGDGARAARVRRRFRVLPRGQAQVVVVVHGAPELARALELVHAEVARVQRPGLRVPVGLHELERLADVLQLVDVRRAPVVDPGFVRVLLQPVLGPALVVLRHEVVERLLLRRLDARLLLRGERVPGLGVEERLPPGDGG